MSEKHCWLCGKETSFLEVGIAIEMFKRKDYVFCEKCLKSMSAYDLFKKITRREFSFRLPLKKIKE